jgi:hypothetical protein
VARNNLKGAQGIQRWQTHGHRQSL